ncbi:MAG: hypothetical protein ACRCW2_02590 [Cellulosilyticaceae bacterium]
MDRNMSMWGLIAFLYILAKRSRTEGFNRDESDGVDSEGQKTFRSDYYKVSFKYPATWVKNPAYKERYEGDSGYFELGEIEAFGKSIDEVVRQEIKSPFKPYGMNPTVTEVVLDGEPARLIVPSGDQATCFDKETALIVKNKTPIMVDGDPFEYLIIWADQNHVDEIIATFKFIK